MKECTYAIMIYLDKYVSIQNSVKMKTYHRDSCEVASWVLIQRLTKSEKTHTICLPIQSNNMSLFVEPISQFQSQGMVATLTKSSLGNTNKIISGNTYFWVVILRSFPSVPCGDDITKQALLTMQSLHNLSLPSKC